jgi:hypothetical protein
MALDQRSDHCSEHRPIEYWLERFTTLLPGQWAVVHIWLSMLQWDVLGRQLPHPLPAKRPELLI